MIEGLDWVREHYVAPAVVVMALGGEPQYALDMAVRALVSAGVPVVVAAGNEDSDACAKSPARCSIRGHIKKNFLICPPAQCSQIGTWTSREHIVSS